MESVIGARARQPRRTPREIADWVRIYAGWGDLLAPEQVVLEKFRARLGAMTMLDVGVGGGRTACHFAPLVREYVGIDFDPGMIEACLRRFPDRPPHVRFMVGDARNLEAFGDESFDFVLFSYNGLDYLVHDDRLCALRQIARVTRAGGYFLFSTHNLRSIGSLFSIRPGQGFVNGVWRPLVLRLWNGRPRRLLQRRHARIYDGVYLGKPTWIILSSLRGLGYYYYSPPEEHLAQLDGAGFEVTAAYDVAGRELPFGEALLQSRDRWIYYLCEKRG
jgi:SAM-dependent methyltransferase